MKNLSELKKRDFSLKSYKLKNVPKSQKKNVFSKRLKR